MYVIFPAEEVVYFTYGYHVISAPPPSPHASSGPTAVQQTQSTSSPATSRDCPQTDRNPRPKSTPTVTPTTKPANNDKKRNTIGTATSPPAARPVESVAGREKRRSKECLDKFDTQRSITNSSGSQKSTSSDPKSVRHRSALQIADPWASNPTLTPTLESTESPKAFLAEHYRKFDVVRTPSLQDCVADKSKKPAGKGKTTKKEIAPEYDFFEHAKSRQRLNTCDLKLNVPPSAGFKQVKSAPSTPAASRRVFKSFETERHISTTNLRASRERTPIKSLLNVVPFVKDKSPTIRIHKDKSLSKQPEAVSAAAATLANTNFDLLFLDPSSGSRTPSGNSPTTPPEKSPTKKISFFTSSSHKINGSGSTVRPSGSGGSYTGNNMAASSNNEATLRELTHPSFNEHLKSHNGVTFKLVKTVSDFTQHLSQIYEQHAEQLQLLVENFRKRNGELRKERPACPSSLFHTWETLLQEVEIDSQNHSDIASILGRQVSRPLLERSFHRKIQSRKVFTHRDSYETIISKTEEKLGKCRTDYKNAYLSYLSGPTTQSLSSYFDTHNAYVQQLHATNGMLDEYRNQTLPHLLQELEEIYADLCTSVAEAVLQGAEVVSQRAVDQSRRYEGLSSQCKSVTGPTDLAHFVRSLPQPAHNRPVMRRLFSPPQPPHADASPDTADGDRPVELYNEQNLPPPLKNELVVDRLSSIQVKPSFDALRNESMDLEVQIKQIQDALDTLSRMQQRSLESSLYNKVNELQEDISIKRFDLRVAQIHLSAINSQKELFSSKLDTSDTGRERKMSASSQGSMKSKWLKAFKSLKTPPSSASTSPRESDKDKKNGGTGGTRGGDNDAHTFQEYTYKKITPCDVCSQVLRGHTRQGLKCRVCKINVHVDCQDKANRCQVKSRLLRRQKSTSEIDTKLTETSVEEEKSPEVDMIYQVLKQATDLSNNVKPASRGSPYEQGGGGGAFGSGCDRPPVGIVVPERPAATGGSGAGSSGSSSGHSLHRRAHRGAATSSAATSSATSSAAAASSTLTVSNPVPHSTSSDRRPVSGPTPNDGSMRRRLFAGMKSLTGFGSRSRHGSPNSRSISLPESGRMRTSSSALMLNPDAGDNRAVAPHSPRRQKLNLRMKSLSLDSPESTEHVQRRRHGGGVVATTSGTLDQPSSNQSSSSRIQFAPRPTIILHGKSLKSKSTPSSPVHNRRLLSARNMRMSSVELPDDNEKSLSSASTSPCPSPVGGKKSQRLLPTNLYVILYNYKSRQADELDLKAGYKVTVIDTSDNDWWKGKCLGKVGYFPSKYCTKLAAGEKPLQVTQNLRVAGGENNEGLLLLRDQIVIQVADELEGMLMVRNGNNQTGCCPTMFLQEV